MRKGRGKRLIKEQDVESQQKKKSIKRIQKESNESEEEEKQDVKYSNFKIMNDDKYQDKSQGKMDKFLNKNKTGNIQPKQSKNTEIMCEESTIYQQKRPSLWGIDLEDIDLDEDEKNENEEELDLSHLNKIGRTNLCQNFEEQAKTQNFNEPPNIPQQQSKQSLQRPIQLSQSPMQFLPTTAESINIREELGKMDLEEKVEGKDFSDQKTKVNNQELRGMSYMIAGEYQTLKKQEIQNIIKFYGGQILTRISKQLNCLVKGEYYVVNNIKKNIEENQFVKEAIKLNCKILDFQAFDQHLKEFTNNSIKESLLLTQQQEEEVEIKQSTKKETEIKFIITESVNVPFFSTSKTKDKDQLQNQFSVTQQIVEPSKLKQQQDISREQQQQQKQNSEQLWSTKHAPKQVPECIDQTHVSKIVNWLDNWGKVQPISFETKTFQSHNNSAKALLLSGPPGIGKTTIIRLIAKSMNYQLIEWNASDVRSKAQIENYVRHLQDNTVLKFKNAKQEIEENEKKKAELTDEQKKNNKNNKKNEQMAIILMDEVDGMSGSDKGGNKCLIDMIKLTKQPIICICNDRNNAKMRSLSLHCLDLQFKRPNVDDVQKKLEMICKNEKLSYNVKELRQQIVLSQCDIRQLLNSLQMQSFGLKSHLSEKANKDSSVTTNIFEAGKKLISYLEASKMSVYELMELYFIDPDILQLMYHENYLDTRFQGQNQSTIMQKISMASQSISEADVLNTRIKRNNEWSLMPNVGFYSCLYPTQKMQSNLFGKMNFPQYLGKISSQNKCKRQLLELKENFGKQTYLSSVKQIKFQFIEPFAFIAITQLQKDGMKSFENVQCLLKNYNLNIATFEECLLKCLSLFPKRDLYQLFVEESVRIQFTKFCKKTMDSSEQMDFGGGSRRQFQRERTQKYNELEDEIVEEEDEQEDEQKKKKQVIKVKQGKTQKQQNKNGKKLVGGKKKKQ